MDDNQDRGAGGDSGVAALAFEGVGRTLGGRAILRDVGFAVPQGTTTAVVGANGAGKTTLLRCLLGFDRADQGSIRIHGEDCRELAARSGTAWLPERFLPPTYRTAREVLQWLAGLRGDTVDESRLGPLLHSIGFPAEALARRVRDLSKGMTQKLGLISIALSPCPIWVLDEPMSGLDPHARRTVARLLQDARSQGRTILFASHGLRELPSLCDQLVVLHRGTQRYVGPAEGFLRQHGATDLETAYLSCIDALGEDFPEQAGVTAT